MLPIIHHNALPIPAITPTPDEALLHFEAIRRLELPGMILRNVGPDIPQAMQTLEPILAACGVAVHAEIPPIITRKGEGDQPVHLDAIPSNELSVGMVMQYTRSGSADIVLAKLAQPFCDELTVRNNGIDDPMRMDYQLPPGTDKLLDEGLVHPEVLQPEVYVGSVAAGDTIMFAFGGPNPIAHRFRSTSPQRHAKGFIVPFTRA